MTRSSGVLGARRTSASRLPPRGRVEHLGNVGLIDGRRWTAGTRSRNAEALLRLLIAPRASAELERLRTAARGPHLPGGSPDACRDAIVEMVNRRPSKRHVRDRRLRAAHRLLRLGAGNGRGRRLGAAGCGRGRRRR